MKFGVQKPLKIWIFGMKNHWDWGKTWNYRIFRKFYSKFSKISTRSYRITHKKPSKSLNPILKLNKKMKIVNFSLFVLKLDDKCFALMSLRFSLITKFSFLFYISINRMIYLKSFHSNPIRYEILMALNFMWNVL